MGVLNVTMTPFAFWASMWRTGQSMLDTGTKLAETAHASQAVIESRSAMIAAASRTPLAGDYAELSRMVPEKVAAFSEGGASMLDDIRDVQAATMANLQMMIGIALKGRPPTVAELSAMTARSMRIFERSAKAAGKALAPVHRGATSNAKRLARSSGG